MDQDDWSPIASAPTDGRAVWVKRRKGALVVKEGWASFGRLSLAAPMRQGEFGGGLHGPIPPDDEAADQLGWCNLDGLKRFPEPTHWHPRRTAEEGAPLLGAEITDVWVDEAASIVPPPPSDRET